MQPGEDLDVDVDVEMLCTDLDETMTVTNEGLCQCEQCEGPLLERCPSPERRLISDLKLDDLFYVPAGPYDHMFPSLVQTELNRLREKEALNRQRTLLRKALKSVGVDVCTGDGRADIIRRRLARKWQQKQKNRA